MFKKLLILILFAVIADANELDILYEEAKKLEESGQYKESLLLYKKIAKIQRESYREFVDDNEIKKIKPITITPIDDRETSNTIDQILSSTFELYPHNENYFLPISYDTIKRADRAQAEAKFQLSVKKSLAHNFFGFNETISFGYTHESWWQIYEESSPFRETNYRPEIFVTVPYSKGHIPELKGYSFGYLHESNGRSGDISRSWNRIYLEGYFQFGNLFVIPKAWYRIPEKESDDDNADIQKYLGYGELKLVYPYKTNTFKLLLRNNLDFDENRGFAELDWSFPIFGSKNTFGYAQFSAGYGDSLIDYNKEVNRISFGVSLSR